MAEKLPLMTRFRTWLAGVLFTLAGRLDSVYDVWLDDAPAEVPMTTQPTTPPEVAALADLLWTANCYDPLSQYAEYKRAEVERFASDILRAAAANPDAARTVAAALLSPEALAEAFHRAMNHSYHGGGWDHGDGDIAAAIAREYAASHPSAGSAGETGR